MFFLIYNTIIINIPVRILNIILTDILISILANILIKYNNINTIKIVNTYWYN